MIIESTEQVISKIKENLCSLSITRKGRIKGVHIFGMINDNINDTYRSDLEKRDGCGVVAHERLTEPRVTMD